MKTHSGKGNCKKKPARKGQASQAKKGQAVLVMDPVRMHLLQTFIFLTMPFFCIALTFWRLGFHLRFVLLLAWLRLFPKDGPFPHISNFCAMGISSQSFERDIFST